MTGSQVHLSIACLFGALGVALWAWATHAGQPSAAIAAQMLLIHAAAIIGLTALRKSGFLHERIAMFLVSGLAFGVMLFAGDLAMRAIVGSRLFPMASPLGGILMMASWLGLGITPFLAKRG